MSRGALVEGVKESNITEWDANISLYCIRKINAERSMSEKMCWDRLMKQTGRRFGASAAATDY